MSNTFRAIPVMNCDSCPHSIDWSSAGIDCQKISPVRRVCYDNKKDRKRAETTTPDWCPLPLVTYNDN